MRGSREKILSISSGLEYESTHPIASAINSASSEYGCERYKIDSIRTFPGMGLSGVLDGVILSISSGLMMDHLEVEIRDAGEHFVSEDTKILGYIEVADEIRENESSVSALQKNGIEVISMISMEAAMNVTDFSAHRWC